LIDAAQLPNEEHRAAAVRALGDLDWSADARTALELAIADSSTVVRKAAVFAIAESGYYDGAADTLMPLLNDDSAHVRALAAESLGVIGSPAAIDALIAASRDNDPEVRAWAVWALDEIEER
jgi:HEAT repeat protein